MDQNRSKSARNRSKSIQDRRKSGPNRSKAVQERQKIDKGRPRTLQEPPMGASKDHFGGQKQKGFTRFQKKFLTSRGSAVTRSLGGGVRGGKLPEFGGVRRFSKGYLERFRSRRKRRVRRIEFASRDRRTLVGVRRWERGTVLKCSLGFRMISAGFRRFWESV